MWIFLTAVENSNSVTETTFVSRIIRSHSHMFGTWSRSALIKSILDWDYRFGLRSHQNPVLRRNAAGLCSRTSLCDVTLCSLLCSLSCDICGSQRVELVSTSFTAKICFFGDAGWSKKFGNSLKMILLQSRICCGCSLNDSELWGRGSLAQLT